MLEIARFRACVVECHGSAPALDALAVPSGVQALRVAPDELLLLAPPTWVTFASATSQTVHPAARTREHRSTSSPQCR